MGGRQQVGFVFLPPDVGAVLGDQRLDVGQALGVEEHLAGFTVVEHGNRHPPGALAGDAPVAAIAHHRFDAIATAGWQPRHRVDRRQGLLTETGHRGEPLFGGAEDGRFLGAPVVGIAMLIALFGQQHAGIAQGGDDRRIGILEHVQAGKRARLIGEGAGFIHRAEHRQAVLAAGVEVVDAVAGGCVHQARARFGGDVVATEHHRAGALQQRMAIADALQLGSLHRQQRFEGPIQAGLEAVDQIPGHHQIARGRLRSAAVAADGVIQGPIHRHRQVGRQGPGGGGPDRHEQLFAMAMVGGAFDAEGPQLARQARRQRHHRKSDIDAGGRVAVGIFQFRLGQGRARAGAPVHRFEPAVNVAGQHHLAKHADLGSLIGLLQGEIGGIPVGPDAPALEAGLLQLHLFERIGMGLLAQADRREGAALLAAQALQHLQFNRQAMAVPARHEAGPLAAHQGVLVDDVLEDLVEGVAHMQGAVGIGRPVMQGEHLPGVSAAELLVQAPLLPEALQFRLALAGIGPHRKGGLQQVEGVLVGDRPRGTRLPGGAAF